MLHTEVVRTESELIGLKDDWRSLLKDAQGVPVFLTWEWITAWWRHYGHEHSLYVIAVRDDAGALVGLAPLMLMKNGWGPLAVRRLVFVGAGVAYPAHLDILAHADNRQAVTLAFLDFLRDRKSEWDMLELVSLAENSPLKPHLQKAGGQYAEGYSMPCPYVALPDNWDTYENQHLSSSLRKNIAYYRRRIERDYPDQVAFESIADVKGLAVALSALREMHINRWSSAGQTTPFENAQYIAFLDDFSAAALAGGWLRLVVLRVRDEIAAVNYCCKQGDVYYGYQRAFSQEWGKYSPGRLLMAHLIQMAIQEGARELDMLHGAAGAKDEWGSSMRSDVRLRYVSDIKGSAWLAGTALLDSAVQFSREHLPESVRRRASRLLPQAQL